MRKTIFVTGLLSISLFCFAGDEPASDKPRSPAAVAAINRHDQAVSRAQQEFQRAISAADRQLATDLDEAMKLAMKAQNVEEIKRIDSARKGATAGTKVGTGSPLVGTWRAHSPAGDAVYYITPTEVHHTNATERCVPSFRGNQVLMRWPTGYVELWVFGAEHALIEGWAPSQAAQVPSVIPANYGVAERVVDEKTR